MNVLMFGWELPPHNSGGLGIACLHLANALAKEHVRVTFVLPHRMEVASHAFDILFADERDISRKMNRMLFSAYAPSSLSPARSSFTAFSVVQELFEQVSRYAAAAAIIAQEQSFDIIHAHDWLSFGAGIEATRVSKKPLITHVHATEFDRGGGNSINAFVYAREKEGMEAACEVITVSNFTKQVVTDHYGIPSSRVSVIHNAVETPLHPSPAPTLLSYKRLGYRVVLFVGRMTLQKGPDYFLRTAKRVLQYYPSTLFVMVGSGDMQGQIIQEASAMGIADNVIFTGFLRDRELAILYQSADVFVMPSVSEPFGIAALEAASYGTPVLISKQSGVSEVLLHALAVDFWDIDEMTNKLVSVLRYGSLKQSLGSNAEAEAKKLTWRDAAKKCLEVYQHALQF